MPRKRATKETTILLDDLLPTEPTDDVPLRAPVRVTQRTHQGNASEILALTAASAAHAARRSNVKKYSKSMQDAFKYFEQAVGGRIELANVLQHCPPDSPGAPGLIKLFEDVDFNAPSDVALNVICRRNKIPLAQLLIAFRDAKVAQLTVDTISRLAQHVPEVTDNLAQDAKNRFETCVVCRGSSRVPCIDQDTGEWQLDPDGNIKTRLCYACHGTGETYEKHDAASRRLFFQLTGLMRDGQAKPDVTVQIANVQPRNFIPGDGSFEQLMKAIDIATIAPSPTEPIDAPIITEITEYEETP